MVLLNNTMDWDSRPTKLNQGAPVKPSNQIASNSEKANVHSPVFL